MWKAIQPGEKLAPGDTIRYRPSSGVSFRDKIFQVVKVELHYFEVVPQPGQDMDAGQPDRKIIKYMDIGYHLALELLVGARSLLTGINPA